MTFGHRSLRKQAILPTIALFGCFSLYFALGPSSHIYRYGQHVRRRGFDGFNKVNPMYAHEHASLGGNILAEEREQSLQVVPLPLTVEIHHFKDRYGLIDIPFTKDELREVLDGVSKVWAQASVRLKFNYERSLTPRYMSPQRQDAYLYYVAAPKMSTKDQNSDEGYRALRKGWMAWLGAGPLGKEGATALGRFTKLNVLLAWITGYFERDPWQVKNEIHVYLMRVFRTYNGYGTPSGVFARAGKCGPHLRFQSYFPPAMDRLRAIANGHYEEGGKIYTQSTPLNEQGYIDIDALIQTAATERGKYDAMNPRETDLKCHLEYRENLANQTYGFRGWESAPVTKDFLIRVIAHEIGHKLLLSHPKDNGCIRYNSVEDANLMQQQRGIALRGGKCGTKGLDNDFLTTHAIKMMGNQVSRARDQLMKVDPPMSPPRDSSHRTIGPSTQVNALSPKTVESTLAVHDNTVLFVHLPAPQNGYITRLRFRMCADSMDGQQFVAFAADIGGAVLPNSEHDARTTRFRIVSTPVLFTLRQQSSRVHHDVTLDAPIAIKAGQVLGISAILANPKSSLNFHSFSDSEIDFDAEAEPEPETGVCIVQIQPLVPHRSDGVVSARDMGKYHGEMGLYDGRMFDSWTKSSNARAIENTEILAGKGDKAAMASLTLGNKDSPPCLVLSTFVRVGTTDSDPADAIKFAKGTLRQLPKGFCTLMNWDFKV